MIGPHQAEAVILSEDETRVFRVIEAACDANLPLHFQPDSLTTEFSFAVNPPAFREILYRGVEIALAKCYTTPTEKNPKAWAAAEFRIRRKDNGEFIISVKLSVAPAQEAPRPDFHDLRSDAFHNK
ncbi:TPA: hypothetical protein DF272_01295 [Candidatus Falkowbacteria bacterium]|nr:hypothetical protein [Candidatus Falkowbacteria bacterium]